MRAPLFIGVKTKSNPS